MNYHKFCYLHNIVDLPSLHEIVLKSHVFQGQYETHDSFSEFLNYSNSFPLWENMTEMEIMEEEDEAAALELEAIDGEEEEE